MSGGTRWLQPLLSDPLREVILGARPGGECHLVGGALRDLWVLGRVNRDWDLFVRQPHALAERIARRLDARVVRLGGDRYDLYRIAGTSVQIDLQEPLESTLDAELRRRDLTVNSIALELKGGHVRDPLSGCQDLAERTLRANSPTAFAEDPLRVLRLLRFAVTLPDFEAEGRTLDLARASAPRLVEVAPERIRQELHKALSTSCGRHLGAVLCDLGLYPAMWSSNARPSRALETCAPRLADLDAILAGIERRTGCPAGETDLEALRHAALLSAAMEDPEAHAASRPLLEAGWITTNLARRIDRILQAVVPPDDEPSRRRLIHRFGASWPSAIALQIWRTSATARGTWDDALLALAQTATLTGETLYDPPPLLNGRELHEEFGVAAGPEMGRLIAALLEAQVEGAVVTPSEAREWLRRRLEREVS